MKKKHICCLIVLSLMFFSCCSNPNIKGWNEEKATTKETATTTEVTTTEEMPESAAPVLVPQVFGKIVFNVPGEWEIIQKEDCIEYKYAEQAVFARATQDTVPADMGVAQMMAEYQLGYNSDGMDLSGSLTVYPPNYEGFTLTGSVTVTDGTERYFRSENVLVDGSIYKIEVSCSPEYSETIDNLLWGTVFVNK